MRVYKENELEDMSIAEVLIIANGTSGIHIGDLNDIEVYVIELHEMLRYSDMDEAVEHHEALATCKEALIELILEAYE